MKITIFIYLLLLLSCSTYKDQRLQNATIEFTIEVYEFGTLFLDAEVTCSFDFKNSGTDPLIIQNVTTSCGCTVQDWPEKPIKSVENASITNHYDTSFPSVFYKTVTVYYNSENPPKILNVIGVVESENDPVS